MAGSRLIECPSVPRSSQSPTQSAFEPADGYDLVAAEYDNWIWQHIWHQFEWPIVQQMLRQITRIQGWSILDIGVGTGTYLNSIVDEFEPRRSVGIDLSKKMLSEARRKLGGKRVELEVCDAQHMYLANTSFDIALMCRVASHIDDLEQVAREVLRILKPGGWLILTDIDDSHPYEVTRIPCGPSKVSIQTYRHSPEEWLRVAQGVDFRTRNYRCISSQLIKSARLDGLPRTLKDTPDHDVAFVLLAQKSLMHG